MNKRVAWIAGAGLTMALSVGLIAPALAYETTPVMTPATEPVVSVPATHAPAVTTDDFAPRSGSIRTAVVETQPEAEPAKVTEPKQTRTATVTKTAAKTTKSTTTKSTSVTKTTTTAPKTTTAPESTSNSADTAASSAASDLEAAQTMLRSLQAKYKYLDGVTVKIAATPGNYQAVTYYRSGRIVISPAHTASISRIMKHEIWHVIDWRDNGKIDWYEHVAPANWADYLN